MRGNLYIICCCIILSLCFFFSCERDAFKVGKQGDFSFSNDTVTFDTIFTNLGSPTYRILLHNRNNFPLLFDSIYLAQGNQGFIVNINGTSILPAKNITVDSRDSLYIFVQAFIPSNETNTPFINEDSLIFICGSNTQNIKLIAFGQNAIHFRNQNIKSQEWFSTKPFLIYGTLTVDSGSMLTIHEGVNVYFHKNAKLKINGTLNISGSNKLPVIFKSDRLQKDYDSIPGQWGGITITGAEQIHNINYAVIRNATVGIQLGEYKNSKLVEADISNTFISNMGYAAMIAYQSNVFVKNSVFANSGNTTCSLYGGSYTFLHCTIANYGAKYMPRSINSSALLLQNYVDDIPKDLQKAYFGNTIIFGNASNEIKLINKTNTFNYMFENCLLRTSIVTPNPNFVNVILNKSPFFVQPENEKFSLDTLSPAKDTGKAELGLIIPFDFENNSRIDDAAPDLGAFERKEK